MTDNRMTSERCTAFHQLAGQCTLPAGHKGAHDPHGGTNPIVAQVTGELAEVGRHCADSNQAAIVSDGKVIRVFGISDEQAKTLAARLYSRITLAFIYTEKA